MGFARRAGVFALAFATAFSALMARSGSGDVPADDFGAHPRFEPAIALGSSCVSRDPSRICMGIKYVVYKDERGVPVARPSDALANLAEINAVQRQCNIAFQIEEFDVVDPAKYGLSFHTANTSDLDLIRERFADRTRLLMVTTGSWNRAGTLGSTSANAWTAMPGSAPYGAVIEGTVAKYSYIFAHELGHYLDLEHVEDPSDLMNPVIYTTSTVLTRSQCETERTLASGFWRDVTRS